MPINQTTIAPLSANQNPIAAMNKGMLAIPKMREQQGLGQQAQGLGMQQMAMGNVARQLAAQKVAQQIAATQQQQATAGVAQQNAHQILSANIAKAMQAQAAASAARSAATVAASNIGAKVKKATADAFAAQQKALLEQEKKQQYSKTQAATRASLLTPGAALEITHPLLRNTAGSVGSNYQNALNANLRSATPTSITSQTPNVGNHKGAPSPYHLTPDEVNLLPIKMVNGTYYHFNPKTGQYYPM